MQQLIDEKEKQKTKRVRVATNVRNTCAPLPLGREDHKSFSNVAQKGADMPCNKD